ncbi:MAG: VOC family protein [Solirubrobacterales bacterium]
MAGELSFFEIGVGNTEQARRFYGALLGWSFAEAGGGASIDAGGAVPGGLHGGDAGASPYVFFRVDDLDSAMDQVRELGGEAEREIEGDSPDSVARFGRFALCKDDQSSALGLHQRPR